MIDYSLLSLKEKLEDGLNVKVDLLGSVIDQATIDTINRMNYIYVNGNLNESGVGVAEKRY